MLGTPVTYAPSISGTTGTTGSAASANDTGRLYSANVWKDCPVTDYHQGYGGVVFADDFLVMGSALMSSAYGDSVGQWAAFGSAGAVSADAALEGGVVALSADDDAEFMKLQSTTGSFRIVTTSTLASNGKLWFETRVARSTVTTDTIEFFAGLMTPALAATGIPVTAVPITATDDTLSTTPSFIGFHCNSNTAVRGGPTEVAFAFNLASGTVNYPTNMTTLMASTGQTVLAADTFVKLGFVFDPNPIDTKVASAPTARQTSGNLYRPLLRVYVNGVELPTFLASADIHNATSGQAFPTGFMGPVLAVANTAGSSPGSLKADWIRVAQRANS